MRMFKLAVVAILGSLFFCQSLSAAVQFRGTSPMAWRSLLPPSSGTLSVSKPSGVVQNDIIIIFVHRGMPVAVNVAGFTRFATVKGTATSNWFDAFYKIAGASEPNSYTVTYGNTGTVTACAIAYSGVNTASPFAPTTCGTGAVTNCWVGDWDLNISSITTTVNNEMLVSLASITTERYPSFGDIPGMTNRLDVSNLDHDSSVAALIAMTADEMAIPSPCATGIISVPFTLTVRNPTGPDNIAGITFALQPSP